METSNPPTNRALDAQIADRVMGWTHYGCTGCACTPCRCQEWLDSDAKLINLPAFSGDPADSRLVLKRMRELGWRISIEAVSKDVWIVEFWSLSVKGSRVLHESLDMAICLAALEAVGQGDKETL